MNVIFDSVSLTVCARLDGSPLDIEVKYMPTDPGGCPLVPRLLENGDVCDESVQAVTMSRGRFPQLLYFSAFSLLFFSSSKHRSKTSELPAMSTGSE